MPSPFRVFPAWLMYITLGVVCLWAGTTGCGRPLVNPESTGRPVVPEENGEQGSGGASRGTGETEGPRRRGPRPRVPASSVFDLPPRESGKYHEVQRGETLSRLGRRYGLSAERIRRANGLEPGVVLQPGQLIYIPNPPLGRAEPSRPRKP